MKDEVLEVLFNRNDWTCYADRVTDTWTDPCWSAKATKTQYFSINPLTPNRPRKDMFVKGFRNVLLEFDKGNRVEQMEIVRHIPYSVLTWSGGKSLHAIISLETWFETREEYDELVRRIYAKVPGADKSVKNPSRLSRNPGAIRDNGNEQTLIDLRPRVTVDTLMSWLGIEALNSIEPNRKTNIEESGHKSLHLNPYTRHFLMFGSQPGKRNADLFRATCDMLRHGYTVDDIMERSASVLDLPHQEILNTVRSAVATVRRSS